MTHLSESELLEAAAAVVQRLGGGATVVGGTRAHFTELNRGIKRLADWHGDLVFSLTPQMHDRSRAQLVESLKMQRLVAEQAVELAAGRALHLGPVTLRPRFNAVATASELLRKLPGADAEDPRQASVGAAAWTLASVAALSVPGVATLTLGESWGRRGLLAGPNGAGRPTAAVLRWLAAAGELVPLRPGMDDGDALAWIAQRRDGGLTQLAEAELAGQPARLVPPAGLHLVAAEDALGAVIPLSSGSVVLQPFQSVRLLLHAL